jgi:ABC-type uncharacterized transport system ATPase subunit
LTSTDRDGEILRMQGITKRYPRVLANDRVDMSIRAGEIRALLGENGAGKSTLMRILYGLSQPDEGEISVRGTPIRMASPRTALRLGIGMVHQHFTLVPNFTTIENVILGTRTIRGPLLDLPSARRRFGELTERYPGLGVEPEALAEQLPIGDQQKLEILKALYRDIDILILDEPTAVLTPPEVRQLLATMRQIAAEGRALIFISHKLEEVSEISDTVTVLRRGRVVGTTATGATSPSELAEMMVGHLVSVGDERGVAQLGAPVLVADGMRCLDERGRAALRDLSFTVHAGEIVGIAGVDGNGQRELSEACAGLRQLDSGSVRVTGRDARAARRDLRLVGFVPEDRHYTGLVLPFSIGENVVLKTFHREPFTRRRVLRWRRIHEFARKLISRLRIRGAIPTTPVRHLSGGNQQRLMVARELSSQPALIVAAQPTRGLDVAAVEAIHGMLREHRERGAAILFISTELTEVLRLSDRILVLFKGEFMGETTPNDATPEGIGRMMLGNRDVGASPAEGATHPR